MDAQWLLSTNCSLTLLPLCLFSCSLSHLLSPSPSCPPCLYSTPPSSAFIHIIYSSPPFSHCWLSPPSFPPCCSCHPSLHPSLSEQCSLPPSLLLLEIFKADLHTYSVTHFSPVWGKTCQLFWIWTRLHALGMKWWVTNVFCLPWHTSQGLCSSGL